MKNYGLMIKTVNLKYFLAGKFSLIILTSNNKSQWYLNQHLNNDRILNKILKENRNLNLKKIIRLQIRLLKIMIYKKIVFSINKKYNNNYLSLKKLLNNIIH